METGQLAGGTLFKTDSNSGQTTEIFSAPVGIQTYSASNQPGNCYSPVEVSTAPGSITSGIVIDADGTIFFGYQSGYNYTYNAKYCLGEPTDVDTSHSVTSGLGAITSNGVTTTQTGIDTASFVANVYPATSGNSTSTLSGGSVTNLTPDGNGGALYTYADANSHTVMMASSSTGTSYAAPLGGGSWVLGENGTAFITDSLSIASFNLASGLVYWTYQTQSQSISSIVSSAASNSLIAKITQPSSSIETPIYLDESGNATNAGYSGRLLKWDFGSAWLNVAGNTLQKTLGWQVDLPNSTWPSVDQNSTYAANRKIKLTVLKVSEANIDDSFVQARIKTATDYWQAKGLLFDWNRVPVAVPACDPSLSGCDSTSDQYLVKMQTQASLDEVYRRFVYDPNGNAGQGLVKLARDGITVLFADLLICFGSSGSGAAAFALPNRGLPNRGGTLNFVLVAHDSCSITSSTSDDVLDHEFGHIFQLDHVSSSNLGVLGAIAYPWLAPVLISPATNLMCGPTGQNDALQNWLSLCSVSRSTRYLTDQQQKTAVGWGRLLLSKPTE